MTIINLGSENQTKIDAVFEVLKRYNFLNPVELHPKKVSSKVSEQPMSAEEITEGADNRARSSFVNCDYSIGYESGIVEFKKNSGEFFDLGMCSIYDGNRF